MIFALWRRALKPFCTMMIGTLLWPQSGLTEHAAAAPNRPPSVISIPFETVQAETPSASQPPAVAPVGRDWHWRLAGTLVGPEHREAVFANTTEARTGQTIAGETRMAAEGDRIDGWTLTSIRPRGVTLTAAGAAFTLSLEGFSPEEKAEAARINAIEHQRADIAARTRLASQEKELEAANSALVAATKKMEGR